MKYLQRLWNDRDHPTFTDVSSLIFLLITFGTIAFIFRGWDQPFIQDRTLHIYSAQEIARGRIPYVDFFNIHPPAGIMLIAIPMWIFPGLRTGTGPAIVHSGLTIIWSSISLIAIYYVAKRLRNNWITGLIAGFIWIGLTPLFLRHFSVGQNRLLVVTSLLLTTVFLQQKKFYWAGFSLAVGFMTYYPTILGIAAVFTTLLFLPKREGFHGFFTFCGGFLTVTAVILLWLVWRGALIPWFNTTLLWPFVSLSGSTNHQIDNISFFGNFPKFFQTMQKGYQFHDVNVSWIPLLGGIAFIHYIISILIQKEKRFSQLLEPKSSPVLVMTIMYLLYFGVESGLLDTFMLQSFIAIWVAWEIASVLEIVYPVSNWQYRIGVLIIALVFGSLNIRLIKAYQEVYNTGLHPRWKSFILDEERSIHTQVAAGQTFLHFVPPEKKIIVLGDMWFNIVNDRENPTLIYHMGQKMQLSAHLAGVIPPEIDLYQYIANQEPEIYWRT